MKKILLLSLVFAALTKVGAQEKLLILNEGVWGTDNGRISYFEGGRIISNQWFKDANGIKLGDTPNDIIQINDNLLAVAVTGSNLIQFIDVDGKAVAVNDEVPNNQKLASDGKYLYISSYAHEVTINGNTQNFLKGYVAKIDLSTFKTVAAVEVGYEPEGIKLYKGNLFVVNTGGYSYTEEHDYESTLSIINSETMKVVRTVDTEQKNLHGAVSISGQYLCINSPGDYYTVSPATVIFDCEAALTGKSDKDCCRILDFPATMNSTGLDGKFYIIGSTYSYGSGSYEYNYAVINPGEIFKANDGGVEADAFPASMIDDFQKLTAPFDLYINPYTGYFYATDSGDYTSAGTLYQWDPEGKLSGTFKTYINPSHMLALPPDGHFNSVQGVYSEEIMADKVIFDLNGVRIKNPISGKIYISGGKKFIFR